MPPATTVQVNVASRGGSLGPPYRFYEMEVADMTRELKRMRNTAAKALQRRETITVLSTWTLQTATCIVILLDYDFNAGVVWLQSKSRRGAACDPTMSTEDLRHRLENFFLQSDVHVLATWTDPQSRVARTALAAAKAFVKSYELALWVRDLNVEYGATVRTPTLIGRYNSEIGSHVSFSADAALHPVLGLGLSGNRMWAYRWRLKYGGKFGSLRAQDPLPLPTRRAKAERVEKHNRWVPEKAAPWRHYFTKNVAQNPATLF